MYRLNEFIGRELHKGERILWSGQPERAAIFSKGDLLLVPASMLWSAMALSFAIPMFAAGRDDSDALPFVIFFAGPFSLMAAYALVGRLIFRLWAKGRVHYLVTDERVIAVSRLVGINVQATFVDEISEIKTAGSTAGTRSMWFGEAPWWMILLGSSVLDSPLPLPGSGGPVAFYDIRHAEQVLELVVNAESRL